MVIFKIIPPVVDVLLGSESARLLVSILESEPLWALEDLEGFK